LLKIVNLIIIQIFLTTSLFAQAIADKSESPLIRRFMVVRTAPAFTLQINLNYNQALFELAGTYNDDFRSIDFIKGETFGADKGFGANVTSKLPLSRKGNLRLIFSASYNRILTYMFGKSGLFDFGETKFNNYSGGAGLENNFTPNHNFKVYAGTELLASLINGKALIWVDTHTDTTYSYNLNIKNAFRLGFSFYGGSEYLLTNNVGVNLGFKLTLANLFLKKSEDPGNSTDIILEDGSPAAPGRYLGKKNFGFFTVHMGICFYWGIIEKRYELKY
jgi:hypothetical protein